MLSLLSHPQIGCVICSGVLVWRIHVGSWAAGDIEKDFWYAFDLLRNPKDHVEFTLVRDWVRDALSGVCSVVSVDREKSVLKQGAVQHLYGRLSGQLKPNANDAHLLVRPCRCQTVQGPAVCLGYGRQRGPAPT